MFDWLQYFADWLIYSVFGISAQSHWGEALNFFVLDTIKIFILLFLITIIMGVVNSYFPVDRVRNFLSRKKMYGLEYLFASSFGVITPFCSCSSVPLFIGFVKGRNSIRHHIYIPHYSTVSKRSCHFNFRRSFWI